MSSLFGGSVIFGMMLYINNFRRKKSFRICSLQENPEFRAKAHKVLTQEWPDRDLDDKTDLVQLVAVLNDGIEKGRVMGFVQVSEGNRVTKKKLQSYLRILPRSAVERKLKAARIDMSIMDKLDNMEDEAILNIGGCSAYLGPLVTDPYFRRQGVATALLAASVGEAQRKFKATSINGLCLHHLIEFYAKVGARPTHNAGKKRSHMLRDLDQAALEMATMYLKRDSPTNGIKFLPEPIQ